MRATWMAAALTAAIVLTPVATASATAAGNEAAAPRTSPFSVTAPALPAFPVSVAVPAVPARPADAPLPVTVPPVGAPTSGLPALPAAPDLSAAPDPGLLLGTVGDLVGTVTGLVSSLTSSLPDLGVVQQLVASLQAVLQGLLGQLPTPPVTVPDPPGVPGASAPARPDQLAALKAQGQSLADAAARLAALHPHPAAG